MSIFDGMAGVLNDVFGAPVLFLPRTGGEQQIKSVFREEPVTVTGEDGREVLIVAPTWKVPSTAGVDIVREDCIEPGNGKRYRILNRIHSGSPASDRFVIYELEAV